MTVARVLEETSSAELSEWAEFFQVERQLREEAERKAAEDRRLVGDL